MSKKNFISGSLWDVLPLLGAPKILDRWVGSMEDMFFGWYFFRSNRSDLSMAGVGIPVVHGDVFKSLLTSGFP